MSENEITRLHAIVEGRVQGVSFRYFVQETAAYLGLNGWVRNRWEGTVEVIAEGERQVLVKLLAALHRGSISSNVTRVKASWHAATGEFDSFRIRRTI